MPATATARVTRSRRVSASRDVVWTCLGDLDRLGSLIDALEEVRPLDGPGHEFLLTPIHALGQRFRPGAKLEVTFLEPERVAFRPVDESADAADAEGMLALTADGDATHVHLTIDVSLRLPIPRLLSAPASAILSHELRGGFDRFLANLAEAAEAA